MRLYLQRHAEPFPGPPMDGSRALTNEGKRQAREMAAFLRKQIGRVDIVISSPFARAMETADIMADALGSYVTNSKMLEPDGEPEAMWKEIERLAQLSKEVLVVGHDPSINALLGWLISGGAVRFEHGAIAHVKVKRRDPGQLVAKLHWFVDVPIVEREEEQEVVEAALAMLA